MKRSISMWRILTLTLITVLSSTQSYALSIQPERPYYGPFSVISQLSVQNEFQLPSDTPTDVDIKPAHDELNAEQRDAQKSRKALDMRDFYLKLLILKGRGN